MSAPDGWINFDASPTLRFERIPVLGRLYRKNATRFPEAVRYGDIVRGLPISSDACRGIYCSHVLEHLAFEDCLRALHNTFRYLAPGGTFRLVMPDLEQLIRAYLASSSDEPGNWLMEISGLGRVNRPRTLGAGVIAWLGNSAHLWLWDEKSMASTLKKVGFKRIRRASFGDAIDSRFIEVEDRQLSGPTPVADQLIETVTVEIRGAQRPGARGSAVAGQRSAVRRADAHGGQRFVMACSRDELRGPHLFPGPGAAFAVCPWLPGAHRLGRHLFGVEPVVRRHARDPDRYCHRRRCPSRPGSH